VKYKNELVALDPLVRRVVETFASSIKKNEVKLKVDSLPTVYGDEDGFEQIFSNLIANAIAYLDPSRPGEIEIGTERTSPGEESDSLVRIFVRDNGRGISQSAQKKLFLAFHRFHPDVVGGEGVGLALVRRVVVTMGGKISCESEEGKGTKFTIALPVSARRMEMPGTPIDIFPTQA
jgi:signal transduction histidine kinase